MKLARRPSEVGVKESRDGVGIGLGLSLSVGKQGLKQREPDLANRSPKQQPPLSRSTSTAHSGQISLQRSADTSPALHSLGGRPSPDRIYRRASLRTTIIRAAERSIDNHPSDRRLRQSTRRHRVAGGVAATESPPATFPRRLRRIDVSVIQRLHTTTSSRYPGYHDDRDVLKGQQSSK